MRDGDGREDDFENLEEEDLTEDKINRLLEEGEALGAEMDEVSLVNCIKMLREKSKKNANLRVKFAGEVNKYIDSEVDLHEEIKILQRIAAYPNLIQVFIDHEGVELILSLLLHENFDIVDDAVVVIEEITDSDYLQELTNPKEFLELFISNNLFDLLVNCLYRITRGEPVEAKEDEQAVTDILSVVENFTEVYSFSAKLFGERTKILPWLIARVTHDNSDNNNRLFASELLNSLTQSSYENQMIFAKKESLPHLLKILIVYHSGGKSKRELSNTEEEFIHNIVNTICSCMLLKDNQQIFADSDGIKFVLSLLKENTFYRHIAIKLLDFATQNNPKNCKELIQNDGLAPLFSYFMGKGFKNIKKFESLIENGEEHCLTIISNLAKFSKSVQLDRFYFKFKENNNEKCERLVEFYKKYEQKLNSRKRENLEEDENSENEDEETIYLKKINGGLFNLQSISIVISNLLLSGHSDIKEKLFKILSINNIKIEDIKNILNEMLIHIEPASQDQEFSNKTLLENLTKSLELL